MKRERIEELMAALVAALMILVVGYFPEFEQVRVEMIQALTIIAVAVVVGGDMRGTLIKLLPVLRSAAEKTPTKIDDQLVGVLEVVAGETK